MQAVRQHLKNAGATEQSCCLVDSQRGRLASRTLQEVHITTEQQGGKWQQYVDRTSDQPINKRRWLMMPLQQVMGTGCAMHVVERTSCGMSMASAVSVLDAMELGRNVLNMQRSANACRKAGSDTLQAH